MEEKLEKINILVTLDENYLKQLNVMLYSMLRKNPGCIFDVYLLHSRIAENAFGPTQEILMNRGTLIPIKVSDLGLEDAPISARYPEEIYYRIFAARYLPSSLERVLYLDPDLIVNGSLSALYSLPMDGFYFAAASHTGTILKKMNELRLDLKDSPYINSGVMLMNLSLLREEQNFDEVFSFIEKRKMTLVLPDQDIISGLYGGKIYALDAFKYNMTEALFQTHAPFEKSLTLDWVRENSVIIHYCGRNKPWKEAYFGQLDIFYTETVKRIKEEFGI